MEILVQHGGSELPRNPRGQYGRNGGKSAGIGLLAIINLLFRTGVAILYLGNDFNDAGSRQNFFDNLALELIHALTQ
jgi:hypothetical protein